MDFDEFLKYALFSRMAYFDYDICDEELHVIGFPLYHKVTFMDRKDTQVWIFESADQDELVIAFRGSDSLGDLLTNFCIFPATFHNISGFVHSGYVTSYKTVRNPILDHVMTHVKRGGKRLSVCGHSLGGACASLCALEMSLLTRLDVSCYSFGAPPSGDPKFCQALLKQVPKYYRIVHSEDFAPALPMLFYKHCDQECHISETSCQTCILLKDPTKISICSHEPIHMGNLRSKTLDYIRHHSIESYIGNIRKLKGMVNTKPGEKFSLRKWSKLLRPKSLSQPIQQI